MGTGTIFKLIRRDLFPILFFSQQPLAFLILDLLLVHCLVLVRLWCNIWKVMVIVGAIGVEALKERSEYNV